MQVRFFTMAMLLEHKSLLQHDPSDFISVDIAVSTVPFFSAEYIVALVRAGAVDGIYENENSVKVSKASLLAYYEDVQAKEKIYDEQNEFYAEQRKALAIIKPILPPLVMPSQAMKALAIIIAGSIVGGFLFFSATRLPLEEDALSFLANVLGVSF